MQQIAYGSGVPVTTTYTNDILGLAQVLVSDNGVTTTHMLFGLGLIAQDEEWRFYQRDGSGLVRQTTNMQATVTLVWTYSPEGAVPLGEEGPVTNLDCSGNTIYDFSTGLIFKNGRYFDPNTGIWVTMGGLVVYQTGWQPYNRKRKWGKSKKRLVLLFMLLLLALTLAGCGTAPEQIEGPSTLPDFVESTPEGGCPVSGYEITYEPDLWNDNGPIQNSTNCYAYALNLREGFPWGHKLQPGELSGQPLASLEDVNVQKITELATSDANSTGRFFQPSERNVPCSANTYKIALVVDPLTDYHWYRQNPDGTWSSKSGHAPVTDKDASGNVIIDPAVADRNYGFLNYEIFGGYFCTGE